MKPRAIATTLVAFLSASLLVVACTSGPHAATPPSTTPAPASSTTAPVTSLARSSSVATTTTVPTVRSVLSALRSDRFDGSDLPAHLHVTSVGRWQYADTGRVGSGYLGSANVSLRSDDSGETISGIYDVFTGPPAASASFARAQSNFRRYSPVGSFRILKVDPPAVAFCGPQAAPANTMACWFVHGSTTGVITATTPSTSDEGDGPALLGSMLTHLVMLGG